MLGNAQVHPTLPAVDLERAKKFYIDTLGLKLLREDPSPGAILEAGDGAYLYIYQRGATKADYTVASFLVDVEATVSGLRGEGVVFKEYDLPGFKTEGGVWTMGEYKGAFFKDTEGNTLAVADM